MKVEEIITNQIIEYLNKGKIPWKQPWVNIFPQNYATKREYSGINFFLLSIITQEKGFKYPYYLTYKQASELGGQVKKGEKGHLVIYWGKYEIEKDEKEDKEKEQYLPFIRYYHVFNVEQCDGIKIEKPNSIKKDGKYEDVLTSYKDKPLIKENGNKAFYNPLEDIVSVPPTSQFKKIQDYYSVLYHELTHSTGNKKRLDRFDNEKANTFGSDAYSKEELIAELGSAFLCARHGIDNRNLKNSAGYIQSWLKVLKDNPKWIITSASKAQKAVNYMMGVKSFENT